MTNSLFQVVGPDARKQLAQQTRSSYESKSFAIKMTGVELATTGFSLARKRLDAGQIEWDDYVRMKGYYNGVLQGTIDSLKDNAPPEKYQAYATALSTYGRLWPDMEAHSDLDDFVKQIQPIALEHITKSHMVLKVLWSLLQRYTNPSEDDSTKNSLRTSIAGAVNGLQQAGFDTEVKALKTFANFDSHRSYDWLIKHQGPLSSRWMALVSGTPEIQPVKSSGLTKLKNVVSDDAPIPMDVDFGATPETAVTSGLKKSTGPAIEMGPEIDLSDSAVYEDLGMTPPEITQVKKSGLSRSKVQDPVICDEPAFIPSSDEFSL